MMKATTIIYQVIFASLLLVGCTKVDLCDEGTHPHVVDGFSVKYDWSGLELSDDETPERLYFVATRILNTRHMVIKRIRMDNFGLKKVKKKKNRKLLRAIVVQELPEMIMSLQLVRIMLPKHLMMIIRNREANTSLILNFLVENTL